MHPQLEAFMQNRSIINCILLLFVLCLILVSLWIPKEKTDLELINEVYNVSKNDLKNLRIFVLNNQNEYLIYNKTCFDFEFNPKNPYSYINPCIKNLLYGLFKRAIL